MDKLTSPKAPELHRHVPPERDVPKHVGTSLTFGLVADVLLVCHGHAPLCDADWQLLLERVAKPGYCVMLVSTLGAEPTGEQRHRLHARLAATAQLAPRIAVLTSSSTMRWAHIARRLVVGLDAKTFPFGAVSDAVSFLGCRAPVERLTRARDRAQYLLEKQAAQRAVRLPH